MDESSFQIPGNGMESNRIDRKLGADPPRNESERAGTDSYEWSFITSSAGNGFRISAADLDKIKVGSFQRLISHTRSLRSSAAVLVMLSVPEAGNSSLEMTIGKAGQMSSISLTGLLGVQ